MNENPLNSCHPKCCTSLYSIYRITLTTTPILAFGIMPLVCNSAGSPIMSPIQQVRHNTSLYVQTLLVGSVHLSQFTCTHHLGVVALLYRSLCDTAKNSHKEELEEPRPIQTEPNYLQKNTHPGIV